MTKQITKELIIGISSTIPFFIGIVVGIGMCGMGIFTGYHEICTGDYVQGLFLVMFSPVSMVFTVLIGMMLSKFVQEVI